jgi:tetratricopeptide (TPR) repeat protein
MLQAQLAERRNQWKEALALYEDILRQAHAPTYAESANLRAALCLSKLDRQDKVLEQLADKPIPDDDLNLLSDVYAARARARAATDDHEGAIMDYLFLVVFYPFVQTNETRCLAATIPHYAAIKDWDAASKTLAALQTQYPEAEMTLQAEALLQKLQSELEKDVQPPQ